MGIRRLPALLLAGLLSLGLLPWGSAALAHNGSDDGPGHDLLDDHGSSRPEGISDDPPGDDSRSTTPTGSPAPGLSPSDDRGNDDGDRKRKTKDGKTKDRDRSKGKERNRDRSNGDDNGSKRNGDDQQKNRNGSDDKGRNQNDDRRR